MFKVKRGFNDALDLFKEVENQVNEQKLDEIVDTVRANMDLVLWFMQAA
ncbi:hypothetical protein [Carnobacterium maltaromaticum]|nr:hypothetical protein [Carnobacterium maltaromaticum]